MRFWIRELTGWLLMLLGLGVFYVCVALLTAQPPAYIQAGWLVIVGIVIFRGGIHLLKIAVAARVCLHAQAEIHKKSAGKNPPGDRRSPW
jgi:hypothetical protein